MRWAFGLLVLSLLIYEGIALWTSAPGDTISEIVWAASRRPLIPFLGGLLAGHFWWPRHPSDEPEEWSH